ncbi:MAG TPA: hypothetical protein VM819_09800 [Vicinamibacterales bacterium]|nr:hypothetical protein [Vicinamibacterales bacterium]
MSTSTTPDAKRNSSGEAARALLDSMSISAGAIVLVIPAVFLAVKGLKREA